MRAIARSMFEAMMVPCEWASTMTRSSCGSFSADSTAVTARSKPRIRATTAGRVPGLAVRAIREALGLEKARSGA